MDKSYLSVGDLAKLARAGGRPVSVQYIRRLIWAGEIEARRVSGVWVITRSAAMRWLQEWLADK